MMQKYPIGIQDFEKLRKGSFLYVDKTAFIEKLLNGGTNFFLSRPRRFGKSLFLNTLKYFFLGRKELFTDLYIENQVPLEPRPVIHLDFSNESWKESGLRQYMLKMVQEHANQYQIDLKETYLAERFQELILSLPYSPVILIDEYDKPILHYIGLDNVKADENRAIMREFYSILKPLEGKIHFLLITGITRFAKTSLFSDMNHLKDLTINKNFATICGYTHLELEFYFETAIQKIAIEKGIGVNDFKLQIKNWYNGYKWNNEAEKVYNPFSILNFLDDGTGEMINYWFASGMPTFLINTINRNGDYDFEEVKASEIQLNNFTIENLNSITLMFQAGYLTIKDFKDSVYTLVYPNNEVKSSLLESILADKTEEASVLPAIVQLRNYFENRDEKAIRNSFEALFAHIPYQIFNEKYEFYYHSILVVAMQLLGCYISSEVSVSTGSIDAVVKTKKHIYIIEFKIHKTAKSAIKQIKEKEYYKTYLTDGRQIVLMGVGFRDKMIKTFEMEELK